MKKVTIIAASVLLLTSPTVYSNESRPVIVTATRTALTVDDTFAPTTVFTRDDIERLQPNSIQDLLRGTPGLAIGNNGGQGKVTSFFLRGAESDQVLVLVDGIRIGSATSGTTPFQDLPLEQIERIEIVRGPYSSLYGSDAIGGVIQIFTRKATKTFTPSFSAKAGSYDTYQLTAGVSGRTDNTWYNVSISQLDTDGFNSCNGQPAVAGCFTIEPDKDGYERLSGSARYGVKTGERSTLEFNWLRSEGESDFDGGFQNQSDTMTQVIGAKFDTAVSDTWQATIHAGQSIDDADNFKDGTFASRFKSKRNSVSFQNDITLSANKLLTAGIDYIDDRVDSSTIYTVRERDDLGVFVQYLAQYKAHNIQASLRKDDNEQFGNHTTGSLAWVYKFSNGVGLRASYGTAFKAPTFNELYFPGFGNPNLQPEESRSYEIGISHRTDTLHWGVNVYQSKVDDLIAFDSSTFMPANIDEAEITGLEAELATQLAGMSIASSLTLLDPVNNSSGSNNGNLLPRRSKEALRVDLDKRFSTFSLGATFNMQGPRYDDLGNTRRLGGYATVDLRSSYQLTKEWTFRGRIENLFDRSYKLASYYNQPERSIYLTVSYQPE